MGAIYADSNFNTAFTKIFPFFKTFLDTILEKNLRVNDYKSELQEIIQKDNENHPEYKIIKERQEMSGRIFRTIVTSRGKEIGVGEGKNKREAEQNAAYDALLKINSNIKYKKLSEVFFIKDD